jgi:hypothetical protein
VKHGGELVAAVIAAAGNGAIDLVAHGDGQSLVLNEEGAEVLECLAARLVGPIEASEAEHLLERISWMGHVRQLD